MILFGEPEEKRQHGRSRHRWEDNIKINLQEQLMTMWTGSSGSSQGPVAGSCEDGSEPSGRGGGFLY
jgi:hypothetical protein